MRVLMNYGKVGLPLELPDEWDVTIIRKRPMPILEDPVGTVAEALRNPVGSRPLKDLASKSRTACILICDITRPVPNGLILPVLIRELLAVGMERANIRVLVATGLHRPNEGEELRELVGDPWVLETVHVANHFARNEKDHVLVGTTRQGTRVMLDRRFVEADLRIATGLVEPHFMAGYSGGRKVITPGVAYEKTITSLHTARYFEHPNSANCILDGNPLHEAQIEVVRMLGGALSVNTVIDEHRRLGFVNVGEVEESHLGAVAFARQYTEIAVPRKFRTVITSAAGYPLDKTYYQTVKGMVGPMDILEPGGDLFIVSEISEGFGSPEYMEAQRRLIALGVDGFLEELLPKGHAAIDEWQTEMQLKPMRIGDIFLYAPALSPDERALTGVRMIDSLDAPLRESVRKSGDTRVAVVPEGPYVVPIYRPV